MTSRERILAALEHRTPDRVPLDLGATPSSGISAVAYNRFLRQIDLQPGPTRVYDVVQMLAQPHREVLDHLSVDVLDVGRAFNASDDDWYDVRLRDGSPAQYPTWFRPQQQEDGSSVAHASDGTPIAKMPASAEFYDQTFFPYLDGYPDRLDNLDDAMSKVLWSAFVHSPWDHLGDDGFWDTLREKALMLRQETDKALMIVVGCNLFEWGTFLRRIDNFLMDLLLDSKNVERVLDALVERHLAFLGKVCQAVGDVVDIVRFGDDLGMDTGPLMAPDLYRKLFKPRHKVMCDYIHKNSSMFTFLHSCGSIHAMIPDLIEAGFEVFNPVQTACLNMEPERLKREFGPQITFWGGGCDTRVVLNHATPKEVRGDVLQRMEVFSPGGGFVFNTVHNILPDVPPENIVAMYAAVAEFNAI